MSRNISRAIAISRLSSSPPPFRKWPRYQNAYGSHLAYKQGLNQARGISSLLTRQQFAAEHITKRQPLSGLHRSWVLDVNRWISTEFEQNRNLQDGNGDTESGPGPFEEGRKSASPGHFRKVAIGNLSASTSWQLLKDHLRTVSDVRSVRIYTDSHGYSTGTAEAYFDTEEGAKAAVEQLNGTVLHGKEIRVSSLVVDATVGVKDRMRRRVFIGNLPPHANWTDVKDHLRTVGTVMYVRMMKTLQGEPKGCAVAEFTSAEEAQVAVEVMNGTMLLDRAIRVSPDLSPEERMTRREKLQSQDLQQDSQQDSQQGRLERQSAKSQYRVFVWGIPQTVDEETLTEHMSTAGQIVLTKIFTDPNGESKGYGIVEYESPEIARSAIALLNQTQLFGRAIRVGPDKGPKKASQERDQEQQRG